MELERFVSRLVSEAEGNKKKHRRTYSPEFEAEGANGICALSLSPRGDAVDYRVHFEDGHTETGRFYATYGEGLRPFVAACVRQLTIISGAENGEDPVLTVR